MSPEDVLASLPIWRGTPVISHISAGRTNSNFIVRDGSQTAFGRVGIDLPHHGVRRDWEQTCATLAAARGVAPQVLHAGSGALVTAYLDGETLSLTASRDPEILSQIAALLRRGHSGPPAGMELPDRCGVLCARGYLDQLSDDELPMPRTVLLDKLGPPDPGGTTLVHCDIIPENLIRTATGLFLIDWEYGGRGWPESDLASVIANGELTPAEVRHFLAAYGSYDNARLQRQRRAMIAREALWSIVQLRHAGSSGDLGDYSATCIRRLIGEFR